MITLHNLIEFISPSTEKKCEKLLRGLAKTHHMEIKISSFQIKKQKLHTGQYLNSMKLTVDTSNRTKEFPVFFKHENREMFLSFQRLYNNYDFEYRSQEREALRLVNQLYFELISSNANFILSRIHDHILKAEYVPNEMALGIARNIHQN